MMLRTCSGLTNAPGSGEQRPKRADAKKNRVLNVIKDSNIFDF